MKKFMHSSFRSSPSTRDVLAVFSAGNAWGGHRDSDSVCLTNLSNVTKGHDPRNPCFVFAVVMFLSSSE